MADYKPTDVFIGVVDLLAVLLPGALLVYLSLPIAEGLFGALLPPLGTELQRWAAFLIAAYVTGHFLHQAGDLVLDRYLYDQQYVKAKRRHGEEPLLAKTRQLMGEAAALTSAFSWAGSFVRVHSASAANEVERAGAESKFFRSFALVASIAAPVAALQGQWRIAGWVVLVALFALWRYCERRWKASQLTYEYFVLLSLHPSEPHRR